MHEVSLGGVLRDYLTGEAVERTTYEDLRQALARMLVEEQGYPPDRLTPKVDVAYCLDGKSECRTVDLVASDADGQPLLVVVFCSGQVGSYERESVAAARLTPGGPAPLVLITDTRDALLVRTDNGHALGRGMAAVPSWQRLAALAREVGRPELAPQAREREERILHAYSGFLKTCCAESCDMK